MSKEQDQIKELQSQLDNALNINDRLRRLELQNNEDSERKFKIQQEDNTADIKRLKETYEFEKKHFKDDEIMKLRERVIELTMETKVKDEKISQLQRLVDLDADIIDIKQLVQDLLGKIPTMDLKNLTIQTQPNNS